jgi:CRISPR-associated endonuclease/helicase Cas3
LIESTYAVQDNEPEAWQQLSDEWFGTDSAKEMLASRNSNLWQLALEDKEGVQTRINEMPTVPVVLCRSLNKWEATFIDGSSGKLGADAFDFATAQNVHKNLVKVPEYCFDRVDSDSPFGQYLYGKQGAGIVMENDTVEVQGLKKGVRLFYFDKVGLAIED